jgi:hypothetical protein
VALSTDEATALLLAWKPSQEHHLGSAQYVRTIEGVKAAVT